MLRRLARLATAVAAVAAVLALSAGSALAAPDTLDQHQETSDYAGGFDSGDYVTAQTFTAGISGGLDRVSLYGVTTDPNSHLTVKLVEGDPTGTILATNTDVAPGSGGWFDATFSPNVHVTANSTYAIVFTGGGGIRVGATCGANAYVGGQALVSHGGVWQPIPTYPGVCITNFAFRTYVIPDAAPIVAPPAITSAFSAATLPLGWSVSLNFTITNPAGNTVGLTGVGFTDTLPTGLTVSTGSASACGTGTVTRTAPDGFALSGGSIATGSNCQFSVMVTGSAAGSHTNTTGAVTSVEGGTGNTASASIAVDAPPTIAAVFNPSSIGTGGTSQLTITMTNPAGNPVPLTFVGLTDTLPAGLTVASGSATVCNGSLTVTAPNSIALGAASIATASQCQFSVTVTASAAGSYTNTVAATVGGFTYAGNTASAALGVAAAAATATPSATPSATPTPTPTPRPSVTPATTSTAHGGGPNNGATLVTLWVLIAAAGIAFVTLTMRSATRVRRP